MDETTTTETHSSEALSPPSLGTPSLGSPSLGSPGGILVEEELLVEEISIDGMCGVY